MAVTTINNYRIWPLLAKTFHNPFQVGNDLLASRALAGPQYCGDQFARKTFINVQWLITGFLIITAEQSQLLMAVHNILRIVKIQNNDLGRFGVRSEKMIDKTLCNLTEITTGN